MPLDKLQQQKLFFACRRGMLELDLLLQPIYSYAIDNFNLMQFNNFMELLQEPDPVIHAWILGTEIPETNKFDNLLLNIQKLNNIVF